MSYVYVPFATSSVDEPTMILFYCNECRNKKLLGLNEPLVSYRTVMLSCVRSITPGINESIKSFIPHDFFIQI